MKPLGIAALLGLLTLGACTPPDQGTAFIPSQKSAVELRMMQSRVVDGNENTVMRDVIATLQDLGYRITKAEPGAGTVSATRLTGLRLAAVVRQQTPGQSVVRANAVVLRPREETQVDDPLFYQQNFFTPLGDMMGRQLRPAAGEDNLPDAVRPVAETLPGQRAKPPAATGAAAEPQSKP